MTGTPSAYHRRKYHNKIRSAVLYNSHCVLLCTFAIQMNAKLPMCTHQNFCIFFLRDTFSILKHAAQVSFDKAAASIKAWRVAHKRWTDRRARQRRNAKNDSGDLGVYSGDCSPMLRMMTDVMQRRGHRATSCTCGVPQMTSVPCRHIVAVTKS